MNCRGVANGTPTVFLQAGAYNTSADWDLVLRELARSGRVCAYDRLGLGLSPDRRTTPSAEHIAATLSELLDRMGERAPIILVGHSNGAFYAEAFTILHPDRVAGLVLVDGVGTDDLDEPAVRADLRSERADAELAVLGGRLGLARLFVKTRVEAIGLKGEAAARKWRDLTSLRHLSGARDEILDILPGLQRIRALGAIPPSVPVAAIVATVHPKVTLDQAWRRAQAAPVRRACQGWLLEAVGASHVSPLGRDRSYIAAAVRWLKTPGLRKAAQCTPDGFKG